MDRRKKCIKTLARALIFVLICIGVLLTAMQTAYADDGWPLVMFGATREFKIGADSQKFLKSIVWAEPPLGVIKKKTITLYWSEDEASEIYKVKSGPILNKLYYLVVEIELIEGEVFDSSSVTLEFHNSSGSVEEPLSEVWPLHTMGDLRHIQGAVGADFRDYRIVRFDSKGGSKVPMRWTEKNDWINPPKNPTRTGYKFDGWWTHATGGYLFDFTQPITKDITLYAHWVSLAPPPTTTTTTTTTTPPPTTTTTTTTTSPPTTTTTEEATTVEETTTEMSESVAPGILDTSPTVPTVPSDGGSDTEAKFPFLLVAGIVVAAILIGGLVGYVMSKRRNKKEDM